MATASKGIKRQALGMFLLAALIGTLGGALGAGFQKAVIWIQHQVIGPGASLSAAAAELHWWQRVLTPALGGVLAGLLLMLLRRRHSPFGITEIIGLVALRKGTIRFRDSFIQILSSACTIGSGGSIGREGANSQIAATVAARLGRLFQVPSRTRSVLLGCGVAAGMACSYNAPIASAIFVMEAVLGNFAMDVFAPVVVASVLSTMLRQVLIAPDPIYGGGLPADLGALSPELVLSALMLGACCGVGGVVFRRSLRGGKRLFARLDLPKPAALGLGGLVVGVIGVWLPEVWGNGFEVIGTFCESGAAPPAMLVLSLLVWKVIGTAATAGSGGLGGVFTPNLVVGAAFGAFFAYAVQWLGGAGAADELRHQQITFTLVGMAGLCAATTHAPITAVVLVFELTLHYELVLPLMLCSITASVVARLLDEDSIYTESLRARGEDISGGIEELTLKTTYVRDVMRRDLATIRDTAAFDEVMDLLSRWQGDTVYVLDGDDKLTGRIQLLDVKNFINDPTLSSVVIAADLARPAIEVTPDESLAAVMPRFDDPDLTELAVTSRNQPGRLQGRVTRREVIAGISTEVLGSKMRTRFRSDGKASAYVDLPDGWELGRRPVPQAWHGLALDALPASDLLGLQPLFFVRRNPQGLEERLPAEPGLVLEAGWDVVALGTEQGLRRLGQAALADAKAESADEEREEAGAAGAEDDDDLPPAR